MVLGTPPMQFKPYCKPMVIVLPAMILLRLALPDLYNQARQIPGHHHKTFVVSFPSSVKYSHGRSGSKSTKGSRIKIRGDNGKIVCDQQSQVSPILECVNMCTQS